MTKATIVIPTAVKDKVKETVIDRATEKFGGATVVGGTGVWRSPDGETERENVETIHVHGADKAWIQAMARFVEENSNQDAVLWSFSEESEFGLVPRED